MKCSFAFVIKDQLICFKRLSGLTAIDKKIHIIFQYYKKEFYWMCCLYQLQHLTGEEIRRSKQIEVFNLELDIKSYHNINIVVRIWGFGESFIPVVSLYAVAKVLQKTSNYVAVFDEMWMHWHLFNQYTHIHKTWHNLIYCIVRICENILKII